MIKPEFGCKRVCVSCAARFYDLTRAPAICPKCSTVQPPPKPRSFPPSRGALHSRYPVAVAPVIPLEADSDAEPAEEVEEAEIDEGAEEASEAEERVAEEV
jgi:uncharacterized protein (TIGR02300 family)